MIEAAQAAEARGVEGGGAEEAPLGVDADETLVAHLVDGDFELRTYRSPDSARCECWRGGQRCEVRATGPAAKHVHTEQLELIARNLWRVAEKEVAGGE